MFQITVSLIRLRCCASSGPYSVAKLCARRVKKTSRAPVEVRVGRLDPAPHRLESRPSRIDHRDDLGIDGHRGGAGGGPGDAQPAEVRRLRRDHRQVGPIRHHRQEQGRVLHGARHRPVHGQILRIGVGPRGNEPDRGPESDHAAEARGVPQRPAEIAAVGDRHHPAGQRRGGTARGASRALGQIVGVAGRAEDGVERVGAGAEFRCVRLAEHDCACLADPDDERLVAFGDVVCVDRRSVRRADTRGVDEVLVRDRQPVQGAHGLPARQRLVRGAGLRQRALGFQCHDRVDRGIGLGDAREVGVEHLAGGYLPGAERPRELDRRSPPQRVHGPAAYARPPGALACRHADDRCRPAAGPSRDPPRAGTALRHGGRCGRVDGRTARQRPGNGLPGRPRARSRLRAHRSRGRALRAALARAHARDAPHDVRRAGRARRDHGRGVHEGARAAASGDG